MHRIQVVDKALHRLIGQLLRLLACFLISKRIDQLHLSVIETVFLFEHRIQLLHKFFIHMQGRACTRLLFDRFDLSFYICVQ